MLHYKPQHVLSSNLLIFRRTNCIITASGIGHTVCHSRDLFQDTNLMHTSFIL